MKLYLLAAGLALGVLSAGGSASATEPHPPCAGTRIVVDVNGPSYVLPPPPAGWTYVAVWSKAGNNDHRPQSTVPGTVITSGEFNQNGQELALSHVDLCKARIYVTTTSTSTTGPTTTSTTIPATTTTTEEPSTTTTTLPETSTTTDPGTATTDPGSTSTVPGSSSTSQPGPTSTTQPGTTSIPASSSPPSSTSTSGPGTSSVPTQTTGPPSGSTSPSGPATTAPDSATRLPATGTSSDFGLAFGAVIVAAGVALSAVARRRV